MNYIIDRFEGQFAVCESNDKVMKKIPKNLLPCEAAEGDIITETEAGFIIEETETQKRKELMRNKLNRLFEQ